MRDIRSGSSRWAVVAAVLLITVASAAPSGQKPDAAPVPATSVPTDPNRYLNTVREFADNVLKYGRDTYGPKHTPLFVDGLNIHTHEPVKWINPDGYKWVLSDFASQQTLMRTLDGLSAITGDPKYRDAAMQATKYMFDNLQAPNGLLYWGHSTAYDALADKVWTEYNLHTLKIHYPYYELMWQVSPEATKRFIEAFWCAHVIDWSNLDMERYASLTSVLEEPWNHEYKGGPVFFEGKGLKPFCTGTALIYAGTTLHKLSKQDQPYIWSKRLARRYIDTRHPKTGISAWGYNNPSPPLGDDMKEHFVDPYTRLFPQFPFQDLLLLSIPKGEGNYHVQPWISLLLVGRMLGEEGREFTQWGLEEFTAWGKVSYRKKDNSFVPMLTDGTSIEGYVRRTLPDGLNVAKPLLADALLFWAYAIAYRETGDDFMWEMVRDIASGNSFGDVGKSPTDKTQLQMDAACSRAWGLLGFLELYAKTNKPEFLQMARRIGDNIIDEKFHKGFFAPSKKHTYTRFDCFEPLALLHLSAAIRSRPECVPQVWPSIPLFLPAYRYKRQGVDLRYIYSLTETAEPPLSLQETASIGDVNMVSSLLAKGVDVNGWDNAFGDTALSRAATNGYREVVTFLLDNGAQIDAKDTFPGATALHYAVEKGHKDIVELLIARGANVNATRQAPPGDASIHSAARARHKDIVELLLAKGADIDAKNSEGKTALDVALDRNHKAIVELLLANGADVNVKHNDGKTTLDVALQEYRQEIVKLFVDRGAEVSIHMASFIGDIKKVKDFMERGGSVDTADVSGQTLLHWAAAGNHKDLAELLIAKGADVNVVAEKWKTPLGAAARAGSTDVAEYLIAHGANVNGREGQWTPLQDAAYYSKEMVELLLAKGANINAGKWTALHSALDAERFDIVEVLLAKGADVNIRDDKSRTALHVAAWYAAEKNPKVVELLLSKGADIDAKDNNGKTALSYAVEGGYAEIAKILRQHGAKE